MGGVFPPPHWDSYMVNNNGEKIKKVLFNEITFFLSIIAVVIGVVLSVTGTDAELRSDISLINQNIETIKGNDLVHLSQRIDSISNVNNEQNVRLRNIENNITKILTILEN